MEKCDLCHCETVNRVKSDGSELWLCYQCDKKRDIEIKTNWITDKEYDLNKLDKIIKDMEERIISLENQLAEPLSYQD